MVADDSPPLAIPAGLLPADGRFGSGPSKVRPEAVAALVRQSTTLLGTSHRRAPVMSLVGRVRSGVADLFDLPDGYRVALGNGGTTSFWDAACFGLVRHRSQHPTFGDFSSRFAKVVAGAPHLAAPTVIDAPPGQVAHAGAEAGVDLYALTHNETSTGAMVTPTRPAGADADALVAVDATSAAGGLRVDVAAVDAYYFAPQKCFASDGGLWIAALSPAAVERIAGITASGRWTPPSLDLSGALARSAANQTTNTPAVATLVLMVEQLEWMLAGGGLEFAAGRCDRSAAIIDAWVGRCGYARHFVGEASARSHVVATVDLDASVDAAAVRAALRANGIVDTEPYAAEANQLRIGLFPAVEPADVEALTACVDHVVSALS